MALLRDERGAFDRIERVRHEHYASARQYTAREIVGQIVGEQVNFVYGRRLGENGQHVAQSARAFGQQTPRDVAGEPFGGPAGRQEQ